ncbi:hypothetical protein [Acinetobacter venetianus]|uniref:hypothetical protein n=1 Tax=Acinetobacter venetianus TaxID=52133 RepID=UPI00214FE1E0|nr:hypothetical protein [Acinetobacter venetianus]MCR4530840.1 hypothetical protein [Acinetobacter venetianus]
MKKIILFCLILVLSGCNKSELNILKEELNKQQEVSRKLELKLKEVTKNCEDKMNKFTSSENKEADILKLDAEKACEEAVKVGNEALENSKKIFELNVAIIAEENKGK